MHKLGRWETPDRRLRRLQAFSDLVSQQMASVTTQAAQEEARRPVTRVTAPPAPVGLTDVAPSLDEMARQRFGRPAPIITPGETTTPEQRLALSAPPTPFEVERQLRESGRPLFQENFGRFSRRFLEPTQALGGQALEAALVSPGQFLG